MPIVDMHFKSGVFCVQEKGFVTPEDAEQWAQALADHARRSPQPIVALIDARRVTMVTPGARRILAEAYRLPNLQSMVVCATNPVIASAVRIIALIGKSDHSIIFEDLEEARRFAESQVSHAANC